MKNSNMSLKQYFIGAIIALLSLPSFALSSAGESKLLLSGQYTTSGGQANYTLPINIPNGRANLTPDLAVHYRSNGNNGPLGIGWQLRGPSSISRCGKNLITDGVKGGIQFNSDDRYCLNGQRLIAITGSDGHDRTEYRVEKNGYAKIISYGRGANGPLYFKVWSKDGSVREYGNSDDSKATLPDTTSTYQWLINKHSDITHQNHILYRYNRPGESDVPLIEEISYVGGKISFSYQTREDSRSFYLNGSKITKNQRLNKIVVQDSLSDTIGEYSLTYAYSTGTKRSLLTNIQYCTSEGCSTKLAFDWQSQSKVVFATSETTQYNAPRFFDINGDGESNSYGVLERNSSTGKLKIKDLAGVTHSSVSSFSLQGDLLSPSVKRNQCSFNVASSYQNSDGELIPYCRFTSCSGSTCKFGSNGTNAGDFNGDNNDVTISGYLIADFNGDGRDDKHRFDKPSTRHEYQITAGKTGTLSSPSNQVLKSIADINNDGYLDVIMGPSVGSGNLYLHYFTGLEFAEPIKLEHTINFEDSVNIADINGDGYPELAIKKKFYLNQFGSISNEPLLEVGDKIYSIQDINGDGWSDILTRKDDNAKVTISYSKPAVQDKITRFNEFAIEYHVQYQPATNKDINQFDAYSEYPVKSVTPSFYLVSQVEKRPQGYTKTLYNYHYKGAKSHFAGGGFLGFQRITETEIASVTTKTETEFEQLSLKASGNPLQTKVFKNDQLVSETRYRYKENEFPGLKASYYQVYADDVIEKTYSLGSTTVDKQQHTTRTVDRFGNITLEQRNITSEHTNAGSFTNTTAIEYLSTGNNVSNFSYRISVSEDSVSPVEFENFKAGVTRYCTESGETYFKPNDLIVLIGTPITTPVLVESYQQYYKYNNTQLTTTADQQSQYQGSISNITKAEFDRSNAYACGLVNVDYSGSDNSATLTYTTSTTPDLITEREQQFWQLAAIKKKSNTLTDNTTQMSRTTVEQSNYHSNGLVSEQAVTGSDYQSNSMVSKSLTTKYHYDNWGNITRQDIVADDVPQRSTSYRYSSNGLFPTAMINAKGHTTAYQYYANGQRQSTTSALKNRVTLYHYDAFGRVTSESLPGISNTTSLDYKLGTACPYATDETVSCVITTPASGGKNIALFDYAGRELRQLHQNFNGQWVSTQNSWDLNGRKTKTTRPHIIGKGSTPAPAYVTFDYDPLNREIKKSEPTTNGGRAEFITQYSGLTTSSIDAKNNKHTAITNVMGYIKEKQEPTGARQTYQYYPDGKLQSSTDSANNITRIFYDSLGYRTKLDDPDMGIWTYRYNALGELTYKQDENGNITRISYDKLGRKVTQTEGGSTSSWQYDSNNAPGTLTQFSGNGNTTEYRYNNQGLTQQVSVSVNGQRTSTSYKYDGLERLTEELRPNGKTAAEALAVQYVYNPFGYLSAVRSPRTAADEEFTSVKFRAEIQQLLDEALTLANQYLDKAERYANQTQLYKDKAQTIRSATQNEHQLDAASISALGDTHKLEQWCNDQGECYLRPLGWVLIGSNPITPIEAIINDEVYRLDTRYSQTESGVRVHQASLVAVPLAEFEQMSLTKAHTFVVKAQPNQQASLFSDKDIYIAAPDSDTQEALYLTAEDLDQAALLASSKQKYYTDLADKLIQYSEQVAVLSGMYCENAALLGGQHSQLANQWSQCGTPDKAGQADYLQLVLDQSQLDTSVATGSYLYYWQRKQTDAYDHTLSEILGNGLTNHYSHNSATGRPDSINTLDGNQTIRSLLYSYDVHNNVTRRDDVMLGIVDNWHYDAQDRVISNTIAVTDKTRHGVDNPDFAQPFYYTYDKLGNITSKTGIGSYTYSKVNAGPHAVTQTNGLDYRYDRVGNMVEATNSSTQANERTLTWTAFNKPAIISRNGNTVSFKYDANHNRYLKTSSDGSETFYFGKSFERVTNAQSGQTQYKHFIYADGKLIALNTHSRDKDNKLENKQVRYLHYDALNSVDMITDGYGNVVERRSYDTWGKQRKISWRSSSVTSILQPAITNRGYTGHEEITEIGLIHMNGRVYDQELGRFISSDPLVQAPFLTGSFNRYAYVWNNPLKYIDPTGYYSSDVEEDNWESIPDVGGYWTVGDSDNDDYYTSYENNNRSDNGSNNNGNNRGSTPSKSVTPTSPPVINANQPTNNGSWFDRYWNSYKDNYAIYGAAQADLAKYNATLNNGGMGAAFLNVNNGNYAQAALNVAQEAAYQTIAGVLSYLGLRGPTVPNKAVSQLAKNKAAGDAFEKQVMEQLQKTQNGVVQQVTVKTQSGTKTRIDLVGRNANGSITCTECKASATAPLTKNQRTAFPEIEQTGGVVVGQGKPGFPGGTEIPPGTVVNIIRP